MAVSSNDVRAVQAFYPRIYLACHIQHTRRTSARANLTEAESTFLGHLEEHAAVRAVDGLGLLARAADAIPTNWSASTAMIASRSGEAER